MKVLCLAVAGICIAFGVVCVVYGGIELYDAFMQIDAINAGQDDSLLDGLAVAGAMGFAYMAALVPTFLGLLFVQTGLLIVLAVDNSR